MDEQEALEWLRLDRPVGGEGVFQLRVRLHLSDTAVIADVAVSQPLVRSGGRLVRFEPRSPGGPGQPHTQMLCLVFGPLVLAPDNRVGLGSLQVGPILTPQDAEPQADFPGVAFRRWLPDPSVPITAALLRLFSPEKIVNDAIQNLRADGHWHKIAERLGKAEPMTDRQLRAYRRLRDVQTPGAHVSDEELKLIARRYLQLVGHGDRHPNQRMALELGLTPGQVRDRIRRARDDKEYLAPTRQGRMSAEPGPNLFEKPETRKRRTRGEGQ